MLSKLRVQHYKSLFDTEVNLEPLTVFIGRMVRENQIFVNL